MKKILLFVLFNLIYSQLSLKLLAEDFDKPVYATSQNKNSDLIYVIEQSGIIWIIENSIVLDNPFLDIEDRVHQPLFPGDEMGLLGCAFDPDYQNNKYIYLNYVDKHDNTIISRFETNDYIANKTSEQIIMKFKQPYSNHNGGAIVFGPDKYLYISVGDGGSASDPENRAQNLDNIFGSILRIKINKDATYNIPEDNPFVDVENARQEIWAYGLRNVWRFSFDRLNGDLFMGDVGQNSWEEINYHSSENKGGDNYGWNIMEASHPFLDEDYHLNNNFINPIFEYPNDAKYIKTILGIKQRNVHGCSVTGGYVYRGKNIPELYGKYIFGDYCTGKVWSFLYENGELTDFHDLTDMLLNSINKKSFYLSSFGELASGELMLIDYSGNIYLLVTN